VIPSTSLFLLPCDTFNKLVFITMWYFQSVICHVILSICLIPHDTFNLFYIMWFLQTVYTMWYFQSVLYHVMYSNCFIPCDTFNLFYIM
jgi:hypothetical protein